MSVRKDIHVYVVLIRMSRRQALIVLSKCIVKSHKIVNDPIFLTECGWCSYQFLAVITFFELCCIFISFPTRRLTSHMPSWHFLWMAYTFSIDKALSKLWAVLVRTIFVYFINAWTTNDHFSEFIKCNYCSLHASHFLDFKFKFLGF